jgi:hypothetical protein
MLQILNESDLWDGDYAFIAAEDINESIKGMDNEGDRVDYISSILDGICPECGVVYGHGDGLDECRCY